MTYTALRAKQSSLSITVLMVFIFISGASVRQGDWVNKPPKWLFNAGAGLLYSE